MAEPDPIMALVEFLLNDANATDLVGTRVYGGQLPRDNSGITLPKTIVISHAGGVQTFGGGYQQFGDIRIDAFCYGETAHEASSVWRVVHKSLKQLERSVQQQVLLHWARPAGGPNTIRDLDTDWLYVLCSWQVLYAEISAV